MTGNKIGGYAAGWDFVDFKVCKGVKKSNTERRQLNKRMRNFLKRVYKINTPEDFSKQIKAI